MKMMTGGRGAGGHTGVLIGDAAVPPGVVNPEDHSAAWSLNNWYWSWFQSTGVFQGIVTCTGMAGDYFDYEDGHDEYVSDAVFVSMTKGPVIAPTNWDTLLGQTQRFGVGISTPAVDFLATELAYGWLPNGGLTLGASDGIGFLKVPADNTIWATISDAAANQDLTNVGTWAKGDVYKFAIRMDIASSAAYFYIDDVLVHYTDAVTLGWWPSNLASNYFQAYANAPAVQKRLLFKPPWFVLGKV